MALLLTDPCDNFTAAPWTVAGAPAVQPGGHTGNGFSIPLGASNNISYSIPAPSQTNLVTVGMWIRFSNRPAAASGFLSFRSDSGATSHSFVTIVNTGSVGVSRASPAAVLGASAAGVIAVATWCYLEVTTKLSDTVGYTEIRVNGTPVVTTAATLDTKSGGTKTVYDQVRLLGNTDTAYIVDDIYVRNDATFPVTAPQVNVWNGSAFVDATVKVWNGSSFVDATAVKVWNGSAFVDAV